jgi:ABC-type Mn2+/Zn2+ transport system ATPase subunit
MSVVLAIDNMTVSYNGNRVLYDVSLEVNAGERVAIVGPNGAGKSTLFRAIVGLIPMERGSVRFGANGKRTEVGYLTQRSMVDWRFPVTVYDVVMMGRIGKIGWLHWYRPADREAVRHSLDQVGMGDYANRQIAELSGGQQQRVFIARALAQEAEILLMDEPFTGVDLPSQEGILEIIDNLARRGIALLVSTHNLTLAVDRFDRLALLNHRLVAYGEPGAIVNSETLGQAFGGQAVWRGENYVMVMGDINCCGGIGEHQHD